MDGRGDLVASALGRHWHDGRWWCGGGELGWLGGKGGLDGGGGLGGSGGLDGSGSLLLLSLLEAAVLQALYQSRIVSTNQRQVMDSS